MRAARYGVATGKGGDFVAIAATRHGTPAAPARARSVIEKEAASWVGANSEARPGTLGNDLSSGPSDCRQEPIQTALASDKFQSPDVALQEKLVMPFGNAQDFVEGFDPVSGNSFLLEQGAEDLLQGCVQPLSFAEKRVRALGVDLRKSEQS